MASPARPVNFDQRIDTIRSGYEEGAIDSIDQGVMPPPDATPLCFPHEKGRQMAASWRSGRRYFTLAMAVLSRRLVASSPGVWPWKSKASSTPLRNTRQWVEPPKWNMPS